MKKLLSAFVLFLFFSVTASVVFAETYQVTTSDGTEWSLMIAPRAYSASGGKSEIRVPGTWTYTKGSTSLTNGIIYPTSWSNYEKESSGTLNDNDLSQGAMMAIFYAVPSEACTGGAIITAIMEMPKATGMSSLGAEITMTPMSGFLCGSQISSFDTYTLKAVTTATVNISGSKTSTTTGTGGTTSSTTYDFTGTYKAEAGVPGAPTMSLTQSGTTLTGTATQTQGTMKLTLTITGTVSGHAAEIKVVTNGINGSATCTGSGSGLIFHNMKDTKKVNMDVRAATTSNCGGNFSGSFVKQ